MARGRIVALTTNDCWLHLRRSSLGRVAVTVASLPEIFPVNFCIIDDDIVFRAGEDTKLYSATTNAVVAFEIDEFDLENQSGWSVLAVGACTEEHDATRIHEAEVELPDGWVPGERDHVMRMHPHRISGRRIETP